MTRLRQVWMSLKSSLWFVPGLMVGAALLLADALVAAEGFLSPEVARQHPRLFGADASGSREMLAAIASSMITVAGVTFSLTLVAITQASSQYSPRVLRNFMGDRANQLFLGYFVAVFAYALVVLRTIRGGETSAFVPSIAVLVGLTLAIASVGILIFFVHHIASSMQASTIISSIAADTVRAIDRLFPEPMGDAEDPGDGASLPAVAWHPAASSRSGYLQDVDAEGLLAFAEQRSSIVSMVKGVGEFVTEGEPLVLVTGEVDQQDCARLNALFSLGHHRTIDQDSAFGVRQIVDIALKALSPGVNDVTTAIVSLDYLGTILVRMAQRRVSAWRRGGDGEVRVIGRGATFESLVADAFDEIRDAARDNLAIYQRILQTIDTIAGQTRSRPRRDVLARHLTLTEQAALRCLPGEFHRARVRERAAASRRRLAQADQGSSS